MSSDASSSSTSEIQINIKGPNELKLQITITTDKTVAELKQAIAEKSDVEADRQRLIYSGRVLKDDDPLTQYKIQSGHTIHMVKSAQRPNQSASSTASSQAQRLPTMQAGQNPHDPLTQLNSHMGYGLMAGLNPFAEMGLNPNDPNMLQSMLNSPQFLQQMAATMSNPAILDQVLASNPQLSSMGPQVRELFQSERFRQMMSNPETLRAMIQMSQLMRDVNPSASPLGGLGGLGGAGSSFPAPGVPGQTQPSTESSNASQGTAGAGAGAAPGAGGGFGALPPFDPAMFAQMQQLLGGAGAGGAASGGAAAGGNPFAALSALGAFGGPGAGGLGSFGDLGGAAASPASAPPADGRSNEERFQVQLQQLQEMGFTNAQQNIRALLATGGNVNSAIEYILSGGGL